MAIHPSRFSGRSNITSPRPVKVVKRGGNKLRHLLGLVLLLTTLTYVADIGWGLASGLKNIPNEKKYPISTNYKDRINILLSIIDGGEVLGLGVASVARGSKTTWLSIDPILMVPLARGYGVYRLGAAWKVGDLDNLQGANLLRDSVSRALAVPIDGLILSSGADWGEHKTRFGTNVSAVASKLAEPLFWIRFTVPNPWPNEISSTFSPLELLTLLGQNRSNGGVRELNFEQTLMASSDPSAPGQVIDAPSFDGLVGKEFREESIVRSRPKVSITNGSRIPGAGLQLARYVKNLGGEVVSVESSTSVKNSSIKDHLGGSQLSRRLAPIIKSPINSDRRVGRSDIEITIGEDALGWF